MKKLLVSLLFVCVFYNFSYAIDPLSFAVGMAAGSGDTITKNYETKVFLKDYADTFLDISEKVGKDGKIEFCFIEEREYKTVFGRIEKRNGCNYKKLTLEEYAKERFPNKNFIGFVLQGDKQFLLLKDKNNE